MRRLFDRLPLIWKYLLMSFLVFLSFYVTLFMFTNRILLIINDGLNLTVPFGIFRNDFIWFFIFGLGLSSFFYC